MDEQPRDRLQVRVGRIALCLGVAGAAAWAPVWVTPWAAALSAGVFAPLAAPWAGLLTAGALTYAEIVLPTMWPDGGTWLRTGVARGTLVLAFGCLSWWDSRR